MGRDGERTSRVAWGARAPVRRTARGPNKDHPKWGGKRAGAGRPKGSKDRKPRKPGLAFENELRDYGLPSDAPKEARDLVNFAVDRVVDVIAERTPAAQSPSILKGAAMLIEMLCIRVRSGEVSIAEAVKEAHERIQRGEKLSLPPPSALPRADVVDVEPEPAERVSDHEPRESPDAEWKPLASGEYRWATK
jgi:hypothetical protein